MPPMAVENSELTPPSTRIDEISDRPTTAIIAPTGETRPPEKLAPPTMTAATLPSVRLAEALTSPAPVVAVIRSPVTTTSAAANA